MSYRISFAEGDDVEHAGRIFGMDNHIFLCANGLVVKVRSKEYHERMNRWIENRMTSPLIFTGENGTKCVMTAPAGSGDVLIELKPPDHRVTQ